MKSLHSMTKYSVAPAEGNKPVSIFDEQNLEALAFPVYFPRVKHTLSADRAVNLSKSKYFNQRLLHADGRFAKGCQYIFYAQYSTNLIN